ncbi:hypothetical protein TPY_1729 [Sulfobacillus acidophilus TPY]|nr:hypothetical protein TPY_1729 [Sulfobacillus acidophilus TPY]
MRPQEGFLYPAFSLQSNGEAWSVGNVKEWPQGIWALLLDSFVSNLGFYLLVPLIAVYLTHELGWPAWQAGVILAVRQLSQQGLAPFGGQWGDRLGYRTAVVLGMEIRAVGFILFGVLHSVTGILLASVLSGLGGALFGPADAAALAASVSDRQRAEIYSWRVVFGNTGMILGPVVGAYLLSIQFAIVAWLAGLLFFFAGVMTWRFYPLALGRRPKPGTEAPGWSAVLRHRPFVQITLIASGYYLLNSQLTILVPLTVMAQHGPSALIGWLLGVYSGTVVLLQPWVSRKTRHWPQSWALVGGLAGGGIAMASGILSRVTLDSLFITMILFAGASMLVNPALYQLTAELADPAAFGRYYGFSRLSLGIGGSLGNAVGGLLVSLGESLALPILPWVMLAGLGAVSALLMARAIPPSIKKVANAVDVS